MGLFDFFKRKKSKKTNVETETRSGSYTIYNGNPLYFAWNCANQIYSIPQVRACIEKISDIFATMPIYHRRIDKNGYSTYLEDNVAMVLTYRPNALQNSTQFFKEAVTKLLLENNLFIQPIWDTKNLRLEGLYIRQNKSFEFELEPNLKRGYVKFPDNAVEPNKRYDLSDMIYLNRFCTLWGGGKNELGLYDTILRSLNEQIINVANPNKPRAILQAGGPNGPVLKPEHRKGVTETIKASFENDIHGLAYIDPMWKITPINWQENEVNNEIMQIIINLVYNYFGMSEKIMNNTASELEMSAFVNTTIKPLALQFEKEFTNKLFTIDEFYHGNRIEFDYNPLLITTMAAKTAWAQTGLRNGFLNEDEAREQFGYAPLPDGLGQEYRTSADLVNIKIVDKYQLGKVGEVEEKKYEGDSENG